MKFRNLLLSGLFICSLFFYAPLQAQLVQETTISAEQAAFQMIAPDKYLIEIAGPGAYYWKKEVDYTQQISIANINKDGKQFTDGLYKMQITPILTLTAEERKELRALSDANELEKMAAYRLAHNLPEQVEVHNINFSIRNGQFVTPTKEGNLKMPKMADQWQQDHPMLYASINESNFLYEQKALGSMSLAMDLTNAEDVQVFTQDVVVQGSICVGFDCPTAPNFGFDTQRYAENNLRIHFDDTSSSASFPGNDWRIQVNDSDNGGANYFAIVDATSNRVPFRIEAGAPANAFLIDDAGNIGIGTAAPVLELHVTDGDTPTLRFEQDGSSGFGSQTWDMAGNETNFFIRDVTNGSLLPFRIRPGAPKNTLYMAANGNIGFGSENPSSKLHVESGDIYVKEGKIGINTAPGNFALNVLGNTNYVGTTVYNGDATYIMTNANGVSYLGANFVTTMRVDAANNRVGIGTATPMHELEVCGTIATTEMSVTTGITCSSDARFKTNIQNLSSSLDKVMQLRGVSYDWRVSEFPKKKFNDEKQIGFIAQELESVVPELVKDDVDGYKSVDYTKVAPILVEAIKEQQNIIDAQQKEIAQLQNELASLADLKVQVAALAELVSKQDQPMEDKSASEVIGEK